jgi:hypothetical protein
LIWEVVGHPQSISDPIGPRGKDVIALEYDYRYRDERVAVGYWRTTGKSIQRLAVDVSTVIGFGRNWAGVLLMRQEGPGNISIDGVQ